MSASGPSGPLVCHLLTLTLIPPLFFVLKMLSAFMSAAYIQVHFRLDFFMKANNMNPDL